MSSSSHSSPTAPWRVPTLDDPSIRPSLPSQDRQLDNRRERVFRKGGCSAYDPAGEDQPNRKRGRGCVDESQFPWNFISSARRHNPSLERDQILKLELLDSWANDPVYVVRKIMLVPGCPDFPYDQWINTVVKGLPVDLDKVLEAFTARPKAVQTHVEWDIAFRKTIEATVFAIPLRFTEYGDWCSYVSNLFAAIHPSFHHKVIDFDKAVRTRVGNQMAIRLTEHSTFDDLRIMHLSEFGRCFYSSSLSERRAPCHKWNRGLCGKSESECLYEHCCDRRKCRGLHRRFEHSSSRYTDK